MPVPQHVLNWLYSVLTSEYHDVNRTYHDVAQALAHYSSLSPRTDVHTFDNGVSALLVHLSGTLPVVFRGVTYRFPISLWVPHAYPKAAPLVYVTPTDNMVVRPGQHVDPQGQVYHPYLAAWSTFWDKSTILDFLAILIDVFAKEPPVVSRQQQHQQQQRAAPPAQQQASPPPVPPLPPEIAPRPISQTTREVDLGQSPPPPPPKPTTQSPAGSARSEGLAPAPPIPARPPRDVGLISAPLGQVEQADQIHRAPQSRYETAPPLPRQEPHPGTRPLAHDASEHVPPTYRQASGQLPHQRRTSQYGAANPRVPAHRPPQYGAPPVEWQPHPHPHPHTSGQYPVQGQGMTIQSQQRQPNPPPPDLLDEPLTLSLPGPSNVPAPPIPPNPEKDALLRQLGKALHARRVQSRQQNDSCMAGLQAQKAAMAAAFAAISQESLSQLSTLLSSNARILRDALQKADSVIEGSRQHPEPDIDELLVAPTVVANQLYSLVAEERAIGDTIFVLGRAVERGRISPAVFVKTTRSLAREWYLKKALVRKIGRGMGLAT